MCEISVVMPVYNSAAYVTHAIESVLMQSFGDFELIIFDDGSTDNTIDLIGACSDKRIKLLRQFGIRICLEKFQLPSLFNAHGQCLGLILEETVCSQCRTEIHEEVMYGAMA